MVVMTTECPSCGQSLSESVSDVIVQVVFGVACLALTAFAIRFFFSLF